MTTADKIPQPLFNTILLFKPKKKVILKNNAINREKICSRGP